jgi:hypothetical protein
MRLTAARTLELEDHLPCVDLVDEITQPAVACAAPDLDLTNDRHRSRTAQELVARHQNSSFPLSSGLRAGERRGRLDIPPDERPHITAERQGIAEVACRAVASTGDSPADDAVVAKESYGG